MFNATLSDGREYDGYVPDFLGKHGDYVKLTIDLDTGQVVDWKKPSDEELDELFKADEFPDDNDEEIW